MERPRLQNQGFRLACWSGASPPPSGQIWLLDHAGLIASSPQSAAATAILLIPDIDQLSSRLRRQMAVRIDATHWEELRQALPQPINPCFSSTSGSAASCSAKPPGPTPAFAWMAVTFKACAICSGFWGHCPHPGRNSWPPILINGPAGLSWITSSCSGAGAWSLWSPWSCSTRTAAGQPHADADVRPGRRLDSTRNCRMRRRRPTSQHPFGTFRWKSQSSPVRASPPAASQHRDLCTAPTGTKSSIGAGTVRFNHCSAR